MTAKIVCDIQRSGEFYGEIPCARKDGSDVPIETIARTVLDQQNRPVALIGINRDITERKRAEAEMLASLREKEMLLKEIHHRVKNNLQVVSSLLSLQARDVADVRLREVFQESQNRVRSMAMVHDKLYGEGTMSHIDFGQYVDSVTRELHRSLGTERISCSVKADQVSLGIDLAIPCGLIVNELVSNSLKHAFKNRDDGRVVVCIRRPDDEKVVISVADNGLGFPAEVDFRTVSSMGMTLILALTDQIGGTIALDRNNGTTFTISFSAHKHSPA